MINLDTRITKIWKKTDQFKGFYQFKHWMSKKYQHLEIKVKLVTQNSERGKTLEWNLSSFRPIFSIDL